jgi:hypothetical protein
MLIRSPCAFNTSWYREDIAQPPPLDEVLLRDDISRQSIYCDMYNEMGWKNNHCIDLLEAMWILSAPPTYSAHFYST